MRLTKEQRDRLWNERMERVRKLIALKAPPCILEFTIYHALGTYTPVWKQVLREWLRQIRLWFWAQFKLRFWWKFVCRKSQKEIEDLITNEGR